MNPYNLRKPCLAIILVLSLLGGAAHGQNTASKADTLIPGEVIDVTGDKVRLSLKGNLLPKVGDPVKIVSEIPGTGIKADVAKGKVAKVETGFADVDIASKTAEVRKGYLAEIAASPTAEVETQPEPGKELDLAGDWTNDADKGEPLFSAPVKKFRLEKTAPGMFRVPGSDSKAHVRIVKDEPSFMSHSGVPLATGKVERDPKTGAVAHIRWSAGSRWTRTAGAGAGQISAADEDLKQLQGDWEIWAEVFKGALLTDEEIRQMNKAITFAGKLMTIHRTLKDGRRLKIEGTIQLNSAAKPNTWDFTGTHYDGKPARFLGLYELKDDSLRLAYNIGDGHGDERRPNEFRTAADTSTLILSARRISAKAPKVDLAGGDLSGRWEEAGAFGKSIWALKRRADGRYDAEQTGLGNASGIGTHKGDTLKIDWATADRSYEGFIEMTLNEKRDFGKGKAVINKGGDSTLPSTLRRIDVSAGGTDSTDLSGEWSVAEPAEEGKKPYFGTMIWRLSRRPDGGYLARSEGKVGIGTVKDNRFKLEWKTPFISSEGTIDHYSGSMEWTLNAGLSLGTATMERRFTDAPGQSGQSLPGLSVKRLKSLPPAPYVTKIPDYSGEWVETRTDTDKVDHHVVWSLTRVSETKYTVEQQGKAEVFAKGRLINSKEFGGKLFRFINAKGTAELGQDGWLTVRWQVKGEGTLGTCSWDPEANEGYRHAVSTIQTKEYEGGYSSQIKRRGAAPARDHTVRLWKVDQTLIPLVFKGHKNEVFAVAFSPDGQRLASAAWDNTAILWDMDNALAPLVLRGHTDGVFSVAFSPNGKRLATGSWDYTVRLWDMDKEREPVVLKGHTKQIVAVAFSPDGNRLASASWDGTLRLWDADKGQQPVVFKGHTNGIAAMAFSPDGQRLASAAMDGTVRLWDPDNAQPPVILKGHGAAAEGVAFNIDGKLVALTFSPDGKRLASASWDKTVRLWDMDNAQTPLVLEGHTDAVAAVAFSPDGKRLASAAHDKTVRLWDLNNPKAPLVLEGHTDRVVAVAFSPDGTWLASASHDGTVRLWEMHRGLETIVLKGHTGFVKAITFSRDGTRLASASYDHTVRVWQAPNRPAGLQQK